MFSDYSGFDAKKFIVVSTVTGFGTYNSVLGWVYFAVAVLSLIGMIAIPVLNKSKAPQTAG